MANNSFNLFVSIFVSFSINGLKENAENLNYYPILRRKVELYLFLSTHREWESFFVASSDTVNSGYDQGERCLSAVFFALLTCWHVQFSKIFAFLFPPRAYKKSATVNHFTIKHAEVKSFLTVKVINPRIFLYFQKVLTMKLWQNTQFTTAILFCFIFTA